MVTPEIDLFPSRGGCEDWAVKILTLGVFGLETHLQASKPIPPGMDPDDFFLGLKTEYELSIKSNFYLHLWGLTRKK